MAQNNYNAFAAKSGIHSLELRFCPVFNPYSKEVVAYRTQTVVYSLEMGTLIEPDYFYAANFGNETGIRLSKWNISEAIRSINKLSDSGLNFDFVMAKCTASFAAMDNVLDCVKSLIKKGDLSDPKKLCLEFPQSLLYLCKEKARKTMLDLKIIGVKTMLSGCGASDCPTSELIHVPLDYVLIEPETAALALDRNKPEVLSKFFQYLKSMNLEVYVDGVYNDDQIRELQRMDCKGIIASDTYEGTFESTEGDRTLEEIIFHGEGND